MIRVGLDEETVVLKIVQYTYKEKKKITCRVLNIK